MISRFLKVDVVLEDLIASDYITLKAFVIVSTSHKYSRTELEQDQRGGGALCNQVIIKQKNDKILWYLR